MRHVYLFYQKLVISWRDVTNGPSYKPWGGFIIPPLEKDLSLYQEGSLRPITTKAGVHQGEKHICMSHQIELL